MKKEKRFRVAFVVDVYWVPDDFVDADMSEQQVMQEFEAFEPTPEQVVLEARGFIDNALTFVTRACEHTEKDQLVTVECKECGYKVGPQPTGTHFEFE